MREILFIAFNDAKMQIRQGSTILWVLIMPPIFFYFIGTVTGGFSSGISPAAATPLTVVAANPGFLQAQLSHQLRANGFEPEWLGSGPDTASDDGPRRLLRFDEDLSTKLTSSQTVAASYDTRASALRRQFEEIRVQRAVYSALADIVVADATSSEPLSAGDLVALNEKPRPWQLAISPAGRRVEIPSGFEQAIPGILVMFTLLVLLTTGGSQLIIERKQGLLRRLASAPVSRRDVVAGKLGGRLLLAAVQIGVALLFGSFLFKMVWGPDFAAVLLVLLVWAAFCAAAGLLLGSVANTEGQAVALGVLAANALAALGGCWWPIEVAPEWMQGLQRFLPTGWTMNALHKLISFQSGTVSAVPEILLLSAATLVVSAIAVRRFRFQ